ncbi:hypothetical protein [Acetilactobacillus jinshanensis]|nr:hypothetical protein [Acetilactobacillus jinshanensis]
MENAISGRHTGVPVQIKNLEVNHMYRMFCILKPSRNNGVADR